MCVLRSHFKGFLPIPLPSAVSPRRPLPATWITRSEYFLSVSTLILTCTVLLDPQPEGRHSGGMRSREGDESARSGPGVSPGSSSKAWEARCGRRPRREPTAGQTGSLGASCCLRCPGCLCGFCSLSPAALSLMNAWELPSALFDRCF